MQKYTKKEKIKKLELILKVAEKELHEWIKFKIECERKLSILKR